MSQQSIQANEDCCSFCFGVLENKLNPKLYSFPSDEKIPKDVACPMFVTYKIKRSGSDEPSLRGCIGNFSDIPLAKGLAQLAIQSAFSDHRFRPISASELPDLQCGVSLLVDFEPAKDAYDWEVGTHGIRIRFEDGYSATYLPEVASEQSWDKETTLKTLVRKAGWYGSIDEKLIKGINLVRYKSSKYCLRLLNS